MTADPHRPPRAMFYVLDAKQNPVPLKMPVTDEDFKELAMRMGSSESRRQIGRDQIGRRWVSTIFLFCDIGTRSRPILYETAIGEDGGPGRIEIVDRYSTADEARAGHAKYVQQHLVRKEDY